MEQEQCETDPQQLRAEAEKEPSRRGLADYSEAIRVLKENKGFSFREIAAWLQQRGMNTDHNAVWRAYLKTIPEGIAAKSVEQIERFERTPPHGGAMPWLDAS